MNTIVWKPKHPEKSRLWQFMRAIERNYSLQLPNYQALHQWSIQHPEKFWPTVCSFFDINFISQPQEIINKYQHPLEARWFTGATFNFAQQLLQRNDNHPALVSIDENGNRTSLCYRELNLAVAACAAGLKAAGITTGDRVGAIMPNVSQTIIAMLASASLGAIWSSCSSDFGAQAAIDRLGQIEPKVLFMADGHQYGGKLFDAHDKIHAVSKAILSLKKLIICRIIHSNLDRTGLPNAVTFRCLRIYSNAFC